MQEKDKPKKKGTLSAIMPRSPVTNYASPMLHDVVTKIVVDDMQFLPKYQENSSYVDLMSSEELRIPVNGTEVIDCGFSIEVPAGYKVVVERRQSHIEDGPILQIVRWESSHKFKVTVHNAGYKERVVRWGSVFAKMHIEPAYKFNWDLFDRSKNG